MSHKKLEEQMILRLPPQVAEQVRKMLRAKQLTEEIEFEFDEDQRNAKFRVGKKKFDAYVVDLPCIVESHKTLDKTTYYKSADIGQMLVVQDPKEPQPPPVNFASPNGITTATRDIQRRKWRKPPDAAMLKEIETEVNRLLKPADNESIEILNAGDYDDLDELNSETIDAPKPKIVFKAPEPFSPEPSTPVAAEGKEKKKKERRSGGGKKKQGEAQGEKAVQIKQEEGEGGGEVKVKKERRRRKKKEDEEGAGDAQEVPNGEKKKPAKRRERKPKAKPGAEPATPASPALPSTPTSSAAPAFPFSSTITPLPPPLPVPSIPSVFAQTPVTTKIHTPAFNANPFANATSSGFPITTTPILAQPIVAQAQPITAHAPASGEGMGYQQLVAQQKKLQQEVDQLKLKVTDATNKYNILPNAILKQRQQGKLQEVTEQHAQKVQELEMVEKQLKEAQR